MEQNILLFGVVIGLLATVDIVLKGFALWRSAKLNLKGWFIALFIFNTAGILPVIFLLTHKQKN